MQLINHMCFTQQYDCIARQGFDTHSDVEEILKVKFAELNGGIDAFSREMKAISLWNNVTIIQTSDFARTLNPNGGNGTDHAWGGNYMMMGEFFFIRQERKNCNNNTQSFF